MYLNASPSVTSLLVSLHIGRRLYPPAGLELIPSWPTGRSVAIWASLTRVALSQRWCQTPRGTIRAQTGSELYRCMVILSVHRSWARSGEVGCWRGDGEQMLFWIRRDQQRLERCSWQWRGRWAALLPKAISGALDCFAETQLNYLELANGFNNFSKLALQKGRAFLSHFLEGLCEELLLDHLGW